MVGWLWALCLFALPHDRIHNIRAVSDIKEFYKPQHGVEFVVDLQYFEFLIEFCFYLQETSPSVVFIKDLELAKVPSSSSNTTLVDVENAKVEGTGSGFIWDKFGHIVGYYHSCSFIYLFIYYFSPMVMMFSGMKMQNLFFLSL